MHHLLFVKPYEKCDIFNDNWLAGFLPSTVSLLKRFDSVFLCRARGWIVESPVPNYRTWDPKAEFLGLLHSSKLT